MARGRVARFLQCVGMCALAGMISVPSSAQESSNLFIQTSGWLVGPATLIPEGDKPLAMPCVMATQYNNGYMVRFSAGGGKIYAMAIDFRQDVFAENTGYDVNLAVGKSFKASVKASALNKGTLVVNLQSEDGAYNALKQGKTLQLAVANTALEFTILGVADGLERVEQCYSASGDKGAPAAMPERKAEAAPAQESFIPPSFSQAALELPAPPAMPLPPVAAEPMQPVPAPASALPLPKGHPTLDDLRQAKQENTAEETNALDAKMAELDRMLEGAAKKLAALETASGPGVSPAGIQAAATFQPAAPVQPAVAAPVPAAAVQAAAPQIQPVPVNTAPAPSRAQPIGKPLASNWLSPYMTQPADAGLKQRDILVSHPGAAADTATAVPAAQTERHWRAMRGSNLREVMAVWARHEQARLVWQAGGEHTIKESISVKGAFPDAVQAVLSQFDGETSRLTGRVYADPGSGEKVLLIESASVF